MISLRTYRILVIASFLLPFVGAGISMATADWLPPELQEYEAHVGDGGLHSSDLIFFASMVAALVALLVATIGLLTFWNPARWLFAALTLGLPLANPLAGPIVESSWGSPFAEWALIFSGVTLALVFFSPLAAHFRPGQPPPLPPA